MHISEILKQIDAHLGRLRQARKLLSGEGIEGPHSTIHGGKRTVSSRPAKRGGRSKEEPGEKKFPSSQVAAPLKKPAKRGVTGAQVPGTVAQITSQSQPAAMAEPERTIEPSVVITRLPAKHRTNSIRTARPRTAAAGKVSAMRPAIALAGPMNTKVVVVPAEQVQREREQAARPAVARPRPPASGLTGKRAFEMLFKQDPAETSGS